MEPLGPGPLLLGTRHARTGSGPGPGRYRPQRRHPENLATGPTPPKPLRRAIPTLTGGVLVVNAAWASSGALLRSPAADAAGAVSVRSRRWFVYLAAGLVPGSTDTPQVVRPMNYAELLQQVQAAGALDRATAEQVSVATVATLAERMRHDELVRLGARLPAELHVALRAGSPSCQPFDADEFVRRVAERMGVEPQRVWTQVRAVLGTLEREVAEMEQVRRRLPREFDALMA
jgi:uncharacterized protein (DUF2267 family)